MQALSTENHHLHNQLADTRRALAELGKPQCVFVIVVANVCFHGRDDSSEVGGTACTAGSSAGYQCCCICKQEEVREDWACTCSSACTFSCPRHSGGKTDKSLSKAVQGAAWKKAFAPAHVLASPAAGKKQPRAPEDSVPEKTAVPSGTAQPATTTPAKVNELPSFSLSCALTLYIGV